jgi:hypothetical protein
MQYSSVGGVNYRDVPITTDVLSDSGRSKAAMSAKRCLPASEPSKSQVAACREMRWRIWSSYGRDQERQNLWAANSTS